MKSRQKCIVLGFGALNYKNLAGLLFCERRGELSDEEVRIEIHNAQMKGFKVVPSCDNHNKEGYCLGHDIYLVNICVNCATKIDRENEFFKSIKIIVDNCEICNQQNHLKQLEISDKHLDIKG